MGKTSSAPDPYATSQAQTQSNQQTANYNAALNRVDQYTPYGSSTYSQTGTDSSGAPQYRQDITLTPLAQQQLNDQLQQNADLSKLGYGLYDQAKTSLANPVSTNGLPSLSGGPTNAGAVQTGVGGTGAVQTSVGNAGSVQSQIAPAGQVQQNLSYGSLAALPDASSFNDAAKAAAAASYGQATSRLDPTWTNSQNDLDAKLANQGIVQGSEAWTRAQDQQSRDRNDAYQTAENNAQAAGLAAQQQGYAQALSTRQQGANEVATAGNFANNAQAQQFSQNQSQATFSNEAQQQLYNQLVQNGTFANAAVAQQFAQALSSGQFANSAQAQQYAQQLQSAQQNNAARSQGLQEQTSLATMPLNELNALRSGTQIQNPTFGSVPQSQAQSTDVAGNIYKSYQLGTANQNNFMNGLFSLGSAALAA